ncbi:MAG TPA: fibronectin type III-like domain-contianing protein [Terracidiphilus sp.]
MLCCGRRGRGALPRPPHTDVSPRLALARFQRLHLDAGETQHGTFNLYPRVLSQVDDKGVRAIFPGQYRISVGGSQSDGDDARGVRSDDFNIVGEQELPRQVIVVLHQSTLL